MLIKDYTEDQIKGLIKIIKDCVCDGRYTISLDDNKIENLQFIEEYNINENKRIDILYNIEYTDFCYGLKNMKDGILKNDLYVFCPKRQLYNIQGKKELIDIYLKFSIIHNECEEYKVIVSLHKRNKPITYIFRHGTQKLEKEG